MVLLGCVRLTQMTRSLSHISVLSLSLSLWMELSKAKQTFQLGLFSQVYLLFVQWHNTMALIQQSCVKMCADLSAGVAVQKHTPPIHENFVNGQSQRTNQRALIKAAAENDRHLHGPPLNIHVSEALPTKVKY